MGLFGHINLIKGIQRAVGLPDKLRPLAAAIFLPATATQIAIKAIDAVATTGAKLLSSSPVVGNQTPVQQIQMVPQESPGVPSIGPQYANYYPQYSPGFSGSYLDPYGGQPSWGYSTYSPAMSQPVTFYQPDSTYSDSGLKTVEDLLTLALPAFL